MRPRLDHVGIAVRNIEDAARVYRQFSMSLQQVALGEGVRIGFIPAGASQLELLEPAGPNTVVGRFIERRGEGLHHVCFEVDDLEAALAELSGRGVELIDPTPRRGIQGTVAFVHPRACRGVLIELIKKDGE
jgi:methylmalonyl-CoA/ethylmalonyl-CoA epimerase